MRESRWPSVGVHEGRRHRESSARVDMMLPAVWPPQPLSVLAHTFMAELRFPSPSLFLGLAGVPEQFLCHWKRGPRLPHPLALTQTSPPPRNRTKKTGGEVTGKWFDLRGCGYVLDSSSSAVSLPVQSLWALCLRHDELGLNDALWISPDGVFPLFFQQWGGYFSLFL